MADHRALLAEARPERGDEAGSRGTWIALHHRNEKPWRWRRGCCSQQWRKIRSRFVATKGRCCIGKRLTDQNRLDHSLRGVELGVMVCVKEQVDIEQGLRGKCHRRGAPGPSGPWAICHLYGKLLRRPVVFEKSSRYSCFGSERRSAVLEGHRNREEACSCSELNEVV